MSITQTVEVTDSYRQFTVPREIPSGPVIVTFTPANTEPKKVPVFGCAKGQFKIADDFDAPLEDFSYQPSPIEEIRKLLQNEMAIEGTSAVAASSGDGWEAYVSERYGES